MRSIAETYHHEVLEAALPETLFASLVELMRVTQYGEWGVGVGGEMFLLTSSPRNPAGRVSSLAPVDRPSQQQTENPSPHVSSHPVVVM